VILEILENKITANKGRNASQRQAAHLHAYTTER